MAVINCPECAGKVSDQAQTCPHCGYTLHNTPKCPKCGSFNVKPISNANKIAGVFMFGALAAHNTVSSYKCHSCGHKF